MASNLKAVSRVECPDRAKFPQMTDARIPFACAALTAAGLYLSGHFGWAWWLGWIAPVPVLWLAFGRSNPMVALAAALSAAALAALGQMVPYLGIVSEPTLGAAVALAGIGFASCVMLARFSARSVSPVAGAIVFAALWTLWDYLAASGPDGALASPGYSQAAAPIVIQTASLYGAWVVTFLIGITSGLAALAFACRNSLYLLAAAALFMLNVAYGGLHMQQDQGPERQVVLIDSDALAEASAIDRRDIALGAVLAYAAEIRLEANGANLVVLPERIAILRPEWREMALDYLRAAAVNSGATIVAGFEERGPGLSRNIALTITPDGAAPAAYVQSSLRGTGTNGVSTAISHDLNFAAAVRMRMAEEQPGFLAIPAWDFGSDGLTESHKAIMRGVESGFAVARSARNGRLMLADALGRTVAMKETRSDGFTMLTASLAAGPDAGRTLYDRIGDTFVWFCALLGLSLVLSGAVRLILDTSPAGDLRARRPRSVPVAAWAMLPARARHAAVAKRRGQPGSTMTLH